MSATKLRPKTSDCERQKIKETSPYIEYTIKPVCHQATLTLQVLKYRRHQISVYDEKIFYYRNRRSFPVNSEAIIFQR